MDKVILKKDQRGFLVVEIINLLMITLVLTMLLASVHRVINQYFVRESYLTAAYLLDGELDKWEYEGEYGEITIGEHNYVENINGKDYYLSVNIWEIKPGLLLAEGRVAWYGAKEKYYWQLSRKILQSGKGGIPGGVDD